MCLKVWKIYSRHLNFSVLYYLTLRADGWNRIYRFHVFLTMRWWCLRRESLKPAVIARMSAVFWPSDHKKTSAHNARSRRSETRRQRAGTCGWAVQCQREKEAANVGRVAVHAPHFVFLESVFFFCCPNNPQGLRASWNPSVNSDCSLSISLFPGLAADTTCQSSYASRFPCGTAAPRRYFLTRATSLARLKKKWQERECVKKRVLVPTPTALHKEFL